MITFKFDAEVSLYSEDELIPTINALTAFKYLTDLLFDYIDSPFPEYASNRLIIREFIRSIDCLIETLCDMTGVIDPKFITIEKIINYQYCILSLRDAFANLYALMNIKEQEIPFIKLYKNTLSKLFEKYKDAPIIQNLYVIACNNLSNKQ